MYKEINKLFNITIPVKNHSEISEKQLNTQISSNKEINQLVEEFKTVVKEHSIQEYIKIKKEVTEKLKDFIMKTSLYKSFNNGQYDFLNDKYMKPSNKVLHFLNDKDPKRCYYLQIDVIQGNYNVLKEFYKENNNIELDENSELYLSSNNFSELVDIVFKDSDIDKRVLNILKSSKSFRQVVFGQLNPKRNDRYLNHIIKKIMEELNLNYEIVVKSQDEVIFAIPYKEFDEKLILKVKEISKKYPVRYKTIDYKIISDIKSTSINEPKKYYIERTYNIEDIVDKSKITIGILSEKLKGVPSKKYLMLYRKYILKEDIQKEDTLFEEDGDIFQFIQV